MSKVVDALELAKVKKDNFENHLSMLDKKQQEMPSCRTYFLEWNLRDVVYNESMRDLWANVVDGLVKLVSDNRTTDENVMKFLNDMMEYQKERVLNHYNKFSTNPVANYIDQIQQVAIQEFCRKSFSCDGLPALISYLEGK